MTDQPEEAQREEAAALERLREAETEAGETLEQAEELEPGSDTGATGPQSPKP